jgi:hypothetical protein
MKKIYTLLIIGLLIIINGNAQNLQNANWHFGEGADFSFLPDPFNPVSLSGSQMQTIEGCATVSDQEGNLLFYTNGITVWNKYHQIMVNGQELMGHISSTQGVIIVPQPSGRNKYFVITIDGVTGDEKGLYYSEVDMSNGTGEVVLATKNTVLKDHNGVNIDSSYQSGAEKLTSTKHANGKDFWVVTQIGGNIYSYLVTGSTITQTPFAVSTAPVALSTIGNLSLTNSGQMKISPDGERIAIAYGGYAVVQSGAVAIGSFDNSTGATSSFGSLIYISTNNYQYYGVEFSPNSENLYFGATGRLYITDSFGSYTPVLLTSTGFSGAFQLAINGKIYASPSNVFQPNLISVINDPNNAAVPDWESFSVPIVNGTQKSGFPQWVHIHEQQCLPNITLTIPDLNFVPYTHKYADYIITNSNYSVQQNQNITLQAGDYILMQPNTNIQTGSLFVAQIAPCYIDAQGMTERPVNTTNNISAQKLVLYPNPASSSVTVSIGSGIIETLSILSLEGKEVMTLTAGKNSILVNTQSLAKGIYVLSAQTRTGETFIEKLIIN